MSFEHQPREVIHIILDAVDDVAMVMRLGLTCRRLYAIASQRDRVRQFRKALAHSWNQALTVACFWRHHVCIASLMTRVPDNLNNDLRWSATRELAAYGHLPFVVQMDQRPDSIILETAATHGRLDVVRWLLSWHPQVEYVAEEAVRSAVRYGHFEVLRLLRAVFPLAQLDSHVAYRAAKYGHVEWLREFSKSPTWDWLCADSALAGACRSGNIQCARLVLGMIEDTELLANAIQLALRYRHEDVAQLIREYM